MNKDGNNIQYPSSLLLNLKTKKLETKIRNKYTDGKFLTIPEYDRIIRKKKINKINDIKYN